MENVSGETEGSTAENWAATWRHPGQEEHTKSSVIPIPIKNMAVTRKCTEKHAAIDK